MRHSLTFIMTMLWIFLLDMIWLGFIAKNLYRDSIGILLRRSGEAMTPNWLAAAVVYVAITTGIIYFVLPRAAMNYYSIFAWGALFGAISYGIYDFTNFSILSNWPFKITIIDFLWGSFLCGTGSLFAFIVKYQLFKV